MDLAKVKRYQAFFLSLSEVDIGTDELMGSVYEDDLLIAPNETQLEESTLKRLRNHDKTKLWVQRPSTEWTTLETALKEKLEIIEKRESSTVEKKIISNIGDLKDIDSLYKMLNELEEKDLTDQQIKKIESIKETIKSLQKDEANLLNKIESLDNQEARDIALKIMNDSETDFSTDLIPDGHKRFFRDLMNFISRLRNVRSTLADIVIERNIDEKSFQKFSEPKQSDLENELENQSTDYRFEQNFDDTDLILDSSLVNELFSEIEEASGFKPIHIFYTAVHELYSRVVHDEIYSTDLADTVISSLKKLRTSLPEVHWALPTITVNEQNLISQAINRLLIYAQVWPENLLKEKRKHLLPSLIFADISLATDIKLFEQHTTQQSGTRTESLREHTECSAAFLNTVTNFPREAIEPIINHHERPDSSGYPRELDLSGLNDEIQKFVICYRYVRLITSWPWSPGDSPRESQNTLWKDFSDSPSQFLTQFTASVGANPSGSTVRLNSGGTALVEKQTGEPDQPIIREITETDTEKYFLGEEKDLTSRNVALSIKESPTKPVAEWELRKKRFNEIQD